MILKQLPFVKFSLFLTLILASCSDVSDCDLFEDPDNIVISTVPTVPCINGERLLMLEAKYLGKLPLDYEWEWEVAGYKSNTNKIKLVGNEAKEGFIKFRNNLSDCFIYKPIIIDAGYANGSAIGNIIWKEKSPLTSPACDSYDPIDELLPGVTVELLSATDRTVLKRDTSDSFGRYLFTELYPGDYIVRCIKPDGMAFVAQNAHVDTDTDCNMNTDGYSEVITLDGCELRLDIDAGLR